VLDPKTIDTIFPPEDDRVIGYLIFKNGDRMTCTGLVTCIFKNDPQPIRKPESMMPENGCNKCDCYFTCIGCCESVCFPRDCEKNEDCERCKRHDNENDAVLDEVLFDK